MTIDRAFPLQRALLAALAVVACAAPAASAVEGGGTGGASAPDGRPAVRSVRCSGGPNAHACLPGGFLALRGEHLSQVRAVVFLGGRGGADDRRARPQRRTEHRVLVRVPARAGSGRVRVLAEDAHAASRPVRVVVTQARPVAAAPAGGGVFPVAAKHDFGTVVNRFGGGRGHQGQDILAACGSPIVAALAGEVIAARWQSAAGNYVVVESPDGTSQVYMHMLAPSALRVGDQVSAGSAIGDVGQTGHASACHLHFESWTAPGWYRGGHPVDPLPALRRWDAAT